MEVTPKNSPLLSTVLVAVVVSSHLTTWGSVGDSGGTEWGPRDYNGVLGSRVQEEGALFPMTSLNLDIGIYSVPRREKGGKKFQEQLEKI